MKIDNSRFCFPNNTKLELFTHFPGHTIHLSTMDPTFQTPSTSLSVDAWYEVNIQLKITESLPKGNLYCIPHLLSDAKEAHEKNEKCILNELISHLEKENITCNILFLDNYPQL